MHRRPNDGRMTAGAMIRQLQNFIEHGLKPTAIVKAWNGDSNEWQPVTGFLYDAESVELQTDCDEDEETGEPEPAPSTEGRERGPEGK